MLVLVTGGRQFYDRRMLNTILNFIHSTGPITKVIHGGATGADQLADDWAAINNVAHDQYPADWNKYGKAAGPIRNGQMLDTGIDLVVAFPGGDGTKDMVEKALKRGVEVIQILHHLPAK